MIQSQKTNKYQVTVRNRKIFSKFLFTTIKMSFPNNFEGYPGWKFSKIIEKENKQMWKDTERFLKMMQNPNLKRNRKILETKVIKHNLINYPEGINLSSDVANIIDIIQDPWRIVIPDATIIEVYISYPLQSTPGWIFRLNADTPSGFTKLGLAESILDLYQSIHQEDL